MKSACDSLYGDDTYEGLLNDLQWIGSYGPDKKVYKPSRFIIVIYKKIKKNFLLTLRATSRKPQLWLIISVAKREFKLIAYCN